MMRGGPRGGLGLALLGLLAVAGCAPAQELEPRAFSPNPVGVNFLVLNYGRSTGGVLFDPSVPITNVEAKLNAVAWGYGHTFSLFGRSATATLVVPYVWGDISGNVGETAGYISRSGFADASLQLSVNLLGGPALSPAEFARRTPETSVGISLVIQGPTGQYDPTKLINIGNNRWGFKPQLGVSQPLGQHWLVECYAGAWFYTQNNEYYHGTTETQAPIASFQLHASYTVRPRLWVALDATGYRGGNTTVGGVDKGNLQENSRVGITLSLPVRRSDSVKIAWSDGATTRVGTKFSTISVAWQVSWTG